jgi:hypothetical protein
MRTLLLTASTLAITTAVPALSADIYVPVAEQFPEAYFDGNKAAGYVDLHYGFIWSDGDRRVDQELRTAGIAGRGNLPFKKGSMFNLQLDGTADTLFTTGDGKRLTATPIEAIAHLYVRDPSRYAVGAFGSYGILEGYDIWGGGLEGQLFLNRVTLYGQGGYRTFDNASNYNLNEWYVRAIGRWFPTDNFRLEGEVGYAQFSADSSDPVDNLFWLATAEYRFDHMPLGVYAQYRGDNFSFDEGSTTSNAAILGVRAYLGSDSQFDNDRRGASFDTRMPLPTVLAGQAEK